jgi:hypothetical protein
LQSWLDDLDLGLALLDHGTMDRITAQGLKGSDLEMVLARDLSLVAQWLDSISTHEDEFFFFEF